MKAFLRFIVAALKPHRRVVALCGFLAVVAALLDMAAPIVMGRLFDLAGKRAAFALYGAAALLWFLIRYCADFIRMFISIRGSVVAEDVSSGYVADTQMALIDKPLSYHYGKKISEVNEKLGTFRWSLRNFFDMGVFDLVPAMMAVVAILVYLSIIDWRIALTMTAALSAYLAYTYSQMPIMMKGREDWNEADSKMASTGWDAIRNILVVKSTTNESFVRRRLDEKQAILMATEISVGRGDSRLNNGQNLIVGAASGLALLFGAMNLAAGVFTAGSLAAVMAYTFSLFGYVRYAQWQFRMLLRGSTDFTELTKELATPDEDFQGGEKVEIKGEVEFCDVRFKYTERPVLEDVCFKVPVGTSVAIVGESGEGKTTMVDLLGRYYEAQSGRILIDGHDIRALNLRSLRSQMAYVPQDLTLFHESLDFNIRYGRPDATDAEVQEAVRLADLDVFVESLPEKLATVVGERGLKLSGGERQRVALARAFLRDPRILILDEPTSHLDSKTEEVIRSSLKRLMAGRTSFLIAHRLKTASEADMILVLKDGRIIESGKHAELAAREGGAYRALLEAQGFR